MTTHNAKECTQCKATLALENLADICKECGNAAWRLITISQYWFDLAVSFGYENTVSAAVLIREFFDVWDVRTYKTFADFMHAEVLV